MSLSKTAISRLKKDDAIKHLGDAGLSVIGSRPELLTRLVNHLHGPKPPAKIAVTGSVGVSGVPIKPPPQVVTTVQPKSVPGKGPTGKLPTKTAIRAMKINDIKDTLKGLNLLYVGDKATLINRLDEHYRPNKKQKTSPTKSKATSYIQSNLPPSTTMIQKMERAQLECELTKHKLDTTGPILMLIRRLEEHYRPPYHKTVPVSAAKTETAAKPVPEPEPEPKPKKVVPPAGAPEEKHDREEPPTEPVAKKPKREQTEIHLQIFYYNNVKIGVCADTLDMYEYDNDSWHPTRLRWNMEENCPFGFESQ